MHAQNKNAPDPQTIQEISASLKQCVTDLLSIYRGSRRPSQRGYKVPAFLNGLPRNLGKFLPPYRWRFGQVGGFSETARFSEQQVSSQIFTHSRSATEALSKLQRVKRGLNLKSSVSYDFYCLYNNSTARKL